MPSEKIAAWSAGRTISNNRTAMGGATMARPMAASRSRSPRSDGPRSRGALTLPTFTMRVSPGAMSEPSGRGWRAGNLLVPLLVAVGVELRAELETVGFGHVGVLLLDVERHVLPVQAGIAVDLLDDQVLRLGRQQPVQELVQHLFVLAVRRHAQVRGAPRKRRVDLQQFDLGRQQLLSQVAEALVRPDRRHRNRTFAEGLQDRHVASRVEPVVEDVRVQILQNLPALLPQRFPGLVVLGLEES